MRYVVRNSLALCACASLLVACQDRGGFQSKKAGTAEEVKAYCEGKNPVPNPKLCAEAAQKYPGMLTNQNLPLPPPNPALTSPSDTPVAPQPGDSNNNGNSDTNKTPGPSVTPTTPIATGDDGNKPANPANPANPAPGKDGKPNPDDTQNGPGASGKVLVENGDQAALLKQDQDAIKAPSEAAAAAKLLRGINVIITGQTGTLSLTMNAIVTIGSDVREVQIPEQGAAMVKFSESGRVDPLMIQVLDEKENSIAPGTLKVNAVCTEKECKGVYLSIDDGQTVAVVAFQPQATKDGMAYMPVATNAKWGDLKQGEIVRSFEEAQAEMKVNKDDVNKFLEQQKQAQKDQAQKDQAQKDQQQADNNGAIVNVPKGNKTGDNKPAPTPDVQKSGSGTAAIPDKQKTDSATGTGSGVRVKNDSGPATLNLPQVTSGSPVLDLVPPVNSRPSPLLPPAPVKQVGVNGAIVNIPAGSDVTVNNQPSPLETKTPADAQQTDTKGAIENTPNVPKVAAAAAADANAQPQPQQQQPPQNSADAAAKLIEDGAASIP